jgi:Flp pilus assembly protein TadG
MTRRRSGFVSRLRESTASDSGAVAVMVAILAPVFLMFAAFSVDVARWYVEGERIQKTADAAALAGAVYLPQDMSAARNAALSVASKNGYAPSSKVTITVEQGSRPSQLKVTISSRITNAFATVAGFDDTTITRVAVSDYNGPAPMGSPCWAFGNEPDPLGQTRPGNCPTTPGFWANIHGPEVDKVQGDQYMTRGCEGGESGCSGSTNLEFDRNGYFYAIHIDSTSAVSGVTLQLFDPAYVKTGFFCDNGDLPGANAYRPNGTQQNPYVNDARTRYAPASRTNPSPYCPGDGDYSSSATTPTTTTFVLRAPVATQNPLQAPVISTCRRQFFGWNDPGSLDTVLDSRNTPAATSITDRTRYQPQLAESFHRWTTFCTIPGPLQRGDYYLQVRTNVRYGAPVADWSGPNDGTSEQGQGANRFGIRAVVTGDASKVSIGSLQKMAIFANQPNNSAPVFNLVRVLPGAAGKRIKFTFFDAGDNSTGSNATVQVKAPLESTGSNINTSTDSISGCQGQTYAGGTENLATCTKTGISPNSSSWQGKAYTIYVPIPTNYNCNYLALDGCWYRMQISFPSGTALTDATTWSAVVEGDPVRLVQ